MEELIVVPKLCNIFVDGIIIYAIASAGPTVTTPVNPSVSVVQDMCVGHTAILFPAVIRTAVTTD